MNGVDAGQYCQCYVLTAHSECKKKTAKWQQQPNRRPTRNMEMIASHRRLELFMGMKFNNSNKAIWIRQEKNGTILIHRIGFFLKMNTISAIYEKTAKFYHNFCIINCTAKS